jgi:hypothetical protein
MGETAVVSELELWGWGKLFRARIRSAMVSAATVREVYWSEKREWRGPKWGPTTFQWKDWVLRERARVS